MSSKIQDRIIGIIKIDWVNDMYDLQPDNAKLPYNYEGLKRSLIKNGFSLPFAVWSADNKYYTIDGHTRKQILLELMNEGYEVPKLLTAFEITAENRNEAIKILIEVYNQKHNPFAAEVLYDWTDIECFEDGEIEFKWVNIVEEIEESENNGSVKINIPTIKIQFEDPEQLQKAEIEIQELLDRNYFNSNMTVKL